MRYRFGIQLPHLHTAVVNQYGHLLICRFNSVYGLFLYKYVVGLAVGEEVAIYFAWLGLYTRALAFPALGGIVVYTSQQFTDIDTNPLTLPYTVFFSMWSVLFLCSWRRQESEFRFFSGLERDGGSRGLRTSCHLRTRSTFP